MSDLKAHCFNPNCEKTFESVNEMVAVPGRGGRSPRHFCESCAERIQRGPPMTDGGQVEDATERCSWCESASELKTSEYAESYLAKSPDGDILSMGYGVVCPECWESIREQWESAGELFQPLASFTGGASA
jgi:hypothetical protein